MEVVDERAYVRAFSYAVTNHSQGGIVGVHTPAPEPASLPTRLGSGDHLVERYRLHPFRTRDAVRGRSKPLLILPRLVEAPYGDIILRRTSERVFDPFEAEVVNGYGGQSVVIKAAAPLD